LNVYISAMRSPSAMSELVNVNPAFVVCALIGLSRILWSAADAAAGRLCRRARDWQEPKDPRIAQSIVTKAI
jgi:hypothetical protein